MAVTVEHGRPSGLSATEVAEREKAGLVNGEAERSSRSLSAIVRANVLTRFNAILGALLLVILVVGPLQDALFGVVLVANTAIGIVQELRAKRTLDRLAVVTAPQARVVRDGEPRLVRPEDVVMDDVLELSAGDQLVVDGVMLDSAALEVDESLLSGESEPVPKRPGDDVLSGSFVAAGSGHCRAVRVGGEAYARTLAREAQRFSLVRSELRAGTDTILRWVTWLLVPTAVLLIGSQMARNDDLAEALRGSVAGVGSMVPEGLVLLTSVAFTVGAVRLSKLRVLVQELPAIEGLARVDVVCVDKTGTLTSGDVVVGEVIAVGAAAPVHEALGALAAADPHPNRSLQAIAVAVPPPPSWSPLASVPFSSARKWSGTTFDDGRGTWVLGAPDVLAGVMRPDPDLERQVEGRAARGERVLLLARGAGPLEGETLPAPLEPAALVVLEEQIRGDAADTLAYFARQGVEVKVISGDHPRTVGAVAQRLGLPRASTPVDARDLPDDTAALAASLEEASVFGRVTPHQKRAIVRALQSKGHVVAMTGDGVNDVLALKDADIGVAMGSGSGASRAVAQLVLMEDNFAVLPPVVGEGRRVIANVERVANLFVTKTVYATILALAVVAAGLPFPFYPRHLTVVSSLTIGIPAFFLALAPNARRAVPGFLGRVLRFAVPAGIVAGAATFAAYALARSRPEIDLGEARTIATITLFVLGLWILAILARPPTVARRWLVGSMGVAFVLVLANPLTREFFALSPPSLPISVAIAVLAVLAALALEGGWHLFRWPNRDR